MPVERIFRSMSRLRSHLSYANTMATIAVFIALGGTSYAVAQLPRNSVGATQIRTGAIGKSEIHRSAVRSKHIRDRTVALRDISFAARSSLRGQAGPAGPQGPPGPGTLYAVAVNSGGGQSRSSAGVSGVNHDPFTGSYAVRLERSIEQCYAVASLSDVPGGQTTSPQGGEIVTAVAGDTVTVRTRNSSGAVADLPFHLVVSC
jgi:hypothetical protein